MPLTTKAKVQVEGSEEPQEVEVEIGDDDLKEAGFIPADDLDARFQERFKEELDRRVSKATEGRVKPEEIAHDDDRLKELRPDLFKGSGDGQGEIPEDRLEEHFEAWKSKHLKPVEEEKDTLAEENQRLRSDRVERDILQAFQSQEVVDDVGMRELIQDHYKGRVRYSPEHDETFLVNEDGDFVASGDGDQPYLTVEEDLRAKRADEEKFGSWFGARSRGGGGFEGSEGADSRTFSGVKYKSDLRGENKAESRANRVAFIEEQGYDAWASLPDERPQEESA